MVLLVIECFPPLVLYTLTGVVGVALFAYINHIHQDISQLLYYIYSVNKHNPHSIPLLNLKINMRSLPILF